MNVNRLRKIIEYSAVNREDIEAKVKDFYAFAELGSDNEVRNIFQIVRTSFQKKGYLVLEIPFADEEIGALCYKGEALGYVVLNTSLPKVNVNFAACHEIYHAFFQENEFHPKVEFANDHYYEHEEEYSANLFAGMLLMPEQGFRSIYRKFKDDSDGAELDTVLRLMNYYQVPYMAALIRCYELGLPGTECISQELVDADYDRIRNRFVELWLDESILDATQKDDYTHLEAVVNRFGSECIKSSCLNERTLRKVLQNMHTLYLDIKGE